MILSASYNLFDGEELLEGSISQIRNQVDYITVIYQDTSNFGEKRDSLKSYLQDLKQRGLIDDFFMFTPNLWRSASTNERTKRNIGLKVAKITGCTHYMSLDTDELYKPQQFYNAKNIIEKGGFDASYCQMQTFYKSWEYRLSPPEDYYVPFIFKIIEGRKHKRTKFKLLVDPTRNMKSKNFKIFERKDLEMMHGSYIRNDIGRKLNNSSSRKGFEGKRQKITDYFINWQYPQKALLAGNVDRFYNVEKVNYFPEPILENYQSNFRKKDLGVRYLQKKISLSNGMKAILNLLKFRKI